MLLKLSKSVKENIIAIGAVAVLMIASRLILMPFANAMGGDAVDRVYIAAQWLHSPSFLMGTIWAPFHFYLIALSLWIFPDILLAPILEQFLFVTLIAIVAMMLIYKVFGNKKAGMWAALIVVFHPLFIRNSFMALSEIPFNFFLLLTLLFIVLSLKSKHYLWWLLTAGLCANIASGIRYEGWIVVPLLGIFLWRKWRQLIIYLILSSIFPIFWMVSSYILKGDFLYAINCVHRAIIMEDYAEPFLKKLFYTPGVVILSFGPILTIIGVWKIIMFIRQKRWDDMKFLSIAIIIAMVFGWRMATDAMFTLGRYIILPTLLFLPYVALGFDDLWDRMRTLLKKSVLIVCAFGLMIGTPYITGIFSSAVNIKPILRATPDVLDVSSYLSKRISSNDAIVVDLIRNYGRCIALSLRIPVDKVFLYKPLPDFRQPTLNEFVQNKKPSYIILASGKILNMDFSAGFPQIIETPLIMGAKMELIYRTPTVAVYRFIYL